MTVNERKLSLLLSDFARTLGTNFSIQAILDHLVERIVDVLPVTAAGVTLISAGQAPRYVAASNAAALRYEQLQTELGEGPCLVAYQTGEAVAVPALESDERFPRFAPAAMAAGLAAVFTFPLRDNEGRLGALDLYRDVPGDLGTHDMEVAQTLADVTAAYLINAQAREDARVTSDNFRHGALHDGLTGLPNRLLLEERLEHAIRRAKRSKANAAILFVDLDRFKQVNDAHGHQVGDGLLIEVSTRLAGLVRGSDTLARFSGDEFVFLCEDMPNAIDATMFAERIDRAFASPFTVAGAEFAVTASVGVAFAGPGEEISPQLLLDADLAMYQAKSKGGAGHRTFNLTEALKTTDRTSMDRDLRSALASDKLDVAYQPVVRCADGVVVGVEALLRWTASDRGPVAPPSMVAVAEQSGLINEIGAWVLARACRDRAQWLQSNPGTQLDLAVNVSPRQLMHPNFCATVGRVLGETGMDPAALVLEITESIVIEDSDRARSVLADLKDIGVRLALDDFGTGYSSLSYLRRLPIDIVKIDQSFIADLDHPQAGGAVVAAVTILAHAFGFSVVAEGVETERQHDAVLAVGCESAQGYYYARPEPAHDIDLLLDASSPNPARLPSATADSVPVG